MWFLVSQALFGKMMIFRAKFQVGIFRWNVKNLEGNLMNQTCQFSVTTEVAVLVPRGNKSGSMSRGMRSSCLLAWSV